MIQQHGQISNMWEEVAEMIHSGCKSSTAIDHWKVLEKQFHHGEAARGKTGMSILLLFSFQANLFNREQSTEISNGGEDGQHLAEGGE